MHKPACPINEQVMVITGATSGIGLVTARKAAARGAKVVLCARDEGALKQLEREIVEAGGQNGGETGQKGSETGGHNGSETSSETGGKTCGQAVAACADVADDQALREVANTALRTFGRIDTWVNNAGVSIYGRMEEVAPQDHRRLFETNFWGVVNGSLVAAEHLKTAGGTIINVGSVLSDISIPLQGMYCASKHAVKGFTDALRMELEESEAPIAVCLIKPSAIDTPYTTHARNYMALKPKNPAPVYDPDLVAQAILHCAEHPHRELIVGGGGKVMSSAGTWLPRLADMLMEKFLFTGQQTDEPAEEIFGSLYEPDNNMQERGEYEGYVRKHSMYTSAKLHPMHAAAAALAASAAAAAGAWFVRSQLHNGGKDGGASHRGHSRSRSHNGANATRNARSRNGRSTTRSKKVAGRDHHGAPGSAGAAKKRSRRTRTAARHG